MKEFCEYFPSYESAEEYLERFRKDFNIISSTIEPAPESIQQKVGYSTVSLYMEYEEIEESTAPLEEINTIDTYTYFIESKYGSELTEEINKFYKNYEVINTQIFLRKSGRYDCFVTCKLKN